MQEGEAQSSSLSESGKRRLHADFRPCPTAGGIADTNNSYSRLKVSLARKAASSRCIKPVTGGDW